MTGLRSAIAGSWEELGGACKRLLGVLRFDGAAAGAHIKRIPARFAAGLQRSCAPSYASDALSVSIRRHLAASGAAVALLVGGLGAWAALTEFSGAVIAPSIVVVDGSLKKVQHPTGGVVGELRVRDGDRVRRGDVLLRLDETQTAVNLAVLVKSLDELTVRRYRLEAEQAGALKLTYPLGLEARGLDDLDLAKLLSGERRLFELRRVSRVGQQAQLKERVEQLREQIKGLEEQLATKKREASLIESELTGVRELYAKKLIPLQRLTALERDAARIGGEHGSLVAAVAQSRAKITETELQILQIDQDLRTEVSRELADLRAKSAELSERKVGAQDQLRRLDIRAPYEGVVHQLAVHTVGGVIGAGEALMMIVPENDALSVEARISPASIDQVREGQRANLRFSAFNRRTTPEVEGVVRRISADLNTDQRSGQSYYVAQIAVPAEQQARLGQRLIPGMPAEAFIQTSERTVLTYLTKPIADQMQRAFRER